MKSILVVGSANADHVFRTPRIPKPGETVLGSTFAIYAGGKGANQAVAAGRLGASVAFVGCVGRDPDAQLLVGSLAEAKVVLRFLRETDLPTGAAGIFVDDQGMNAIVAAPGANGLVTADHVKDALQVFRPGIVLCQLEVPMEAVEAASHGPMFVLNPAPARDIPDEIWARCFAVTPNEFELEFATGIAPADEASCIAAAQKLLDKGVENVIVTLGERGCQWVSAAGSQSFAPPQVHAIDTTGAGDVFNGGLVTFLAEGRTLPECLELANRAAALSTTRPGAQSSAPTRDELDH